MLALFRDLKARQGDQPDLAQRLWIIAVALVVIFLAAVLNAALPPQVLDPRWLQALIQALLGNGFFL
jgi:hypothetical protein